MNIIETIEKIADGFRCFKSYVKCIQLGKKKKIKIYKSIRR
jgi:hypothetical protein